MKRSTNLVINIVLLSVLVMPAFSAGPKVLGTWVDREGVVKCDISIESSGGQYEEVWRNCEEPRANEIRRPLKQIGKNRFKQTQFKSLTWFYAIGTSGDLEVRDSQGLIRTINMKGPQTIEQHQARLKSAGVYVGMSAGQVLASNWGQPIKVNRTTASRATQEQWVYRGAYLYFENGFLTAIQN